MNQMKIANRIMLAAIAAASSAFGATATWTQTGSATSTNDAAPDSNMSWLVAGNWSNSVLPDVSDVIMFDNVVTDTSAMSGIIGRYVVHLNTNFLGTAASSLTLNQTTSGFTNNLQIRQDAAIDNHLTFSVGAVNISSGSQLIYNGAVSTVNTTGQDQRNLYLGEGGQNVSNDGTILLTYQGAANNRIVRGSLKIADGATFSNSGNFTLTANSRNDPASGSTRLNAQIGATTNTGNITINRSGDSKNSSDAYDAARGGIRFTSLNNASATSSFSMTVNNSTLRDTNDGLTAQPALADPAATLVISGALQNSGTFTLNRTPLPTGTGASNTNTDAVSRVFDVSIGSMNNAASGAFVVNHSNSATALTTTSSTVDITVSGNATNAGLLSLKGTATSVSAGAILTRLQTKGGFTNVSGGIINVNGTAVLANTGDLANYNTQTSRSIQGSTQSWNTQGLTISSASTGDANLIWATGVEMSGTLTSGAAGSFGNSHFTIGNLLLDSGAGTYTLSGGSDLYIAGTFTLTGLLNLGDWSSATTDGSQAQTLVFDDYSLRATVDALIDTGKITATLANGRKLATFSNDSDDAFYIGTTVSEIPEPATIGILAIGATLMFRRRNATRH